MERVKIELKNLFYLINQPEMKVLPAHLAFFMVLSIIPTITSIAAISTLFKVPLNGLIDTMQGILPNEVSSILLPIINGEGLTATLGVSMIVFFFLASNGTHSIIVVSNTMYGIKHANYINRRIKAIVLIIILLLLIVFNLVVIAFGNNIVNWLLQLNFLSSVSNVLYQIFILLKWPFALLFVFFLVKLIYTIAPDSKMSSKYTNKGAVFTTILWSLATVIYSFYVTNFTDYSLFYGGLTNIIVMMIWIYIISYILVLGMAVNVSTYKMEMTKDDNWDKKD